MRSIYLFLLLTTIFSLNSIADEVPKQNLLRCKKVLDIYTGTLDEEFSKIEEKPKFPGGDEAFFHQVYDLLGFNPEKVTSIDEITIVKFLITPEGAIQDVTIENTSNEEYDKKIISTIASLPNFLPSNTSDNYYYAWVNICCPK